MEAYGVWLLVGLALTITELITGTFYLLVLGAAAFAGSFVAFSGMGFLMQAIAASIIGAGGVFAVNHWRRRQKHSRPSDNNMDIGQPVVFESWVNETERLARVKYRGSNWEAFLIGDGAVQAHDILYIRGVEGNQLQVESTKSLSH